MNINMKTLFLRLFYAYLIDNPITSMTRMLCGSHNLGSAGAMNTLQINASAPDVKVTYILRYIIQKIYQRILKYIISLAKFIKGDIFLFFIKRIAL